MDEQNDKFMQQCDECIDQMQNEEREKKYESILVISVLFLLESTVNCLKPKKLQRNASTTKFMVRGLKMLSEMTSICT